MSTNSSDDNKFQLAGERYTAAAQTFPFIFTFQDCGKLTLNFDGSATFEGNADEAAKLFFDNVISLHNHQYNEYAKQLQALVAENVELKRSVQHAGDCIQAAYVEGLQEALLDSQDERLSDLVNRRLIHAYEEVNTPATDAAIKVIQADGADLLRAKIEALSTVDEYTGGNEYIRRISVLNEADTLSQQLRDGKIPYYQLSNELRAQGVDSGINTITMILNHQAPGVKDAINVLRNHAAELRNE